MKSRTAPFQVVPALDLRAGIVVEARGGRRDDYRPLRSALCASADPADVVAGLLTVAGFGAIYVADLDAIAGTGDNDRVLRRLWSEFARLEFWVDRGLRTAAAGRVWVARELGTPVIGSESRPEPELVASLGGDGGLLSLDHRGGGFDGPAELLAEAARWPARVIVMELDRVGAGSGPDLGRLGSIVARAGPRAVFAAGGVRDARDLRAVRASGAAGALIATALHERRIRSEDILAARGAARISPHSDA